VLTDGVRAKLFFAVAQGAPWDIAARASGITDKTFQNWRKWAKEGKEPYAGLMVELSEAEATAEVGILTTLQSASKGQLPSSAKPDAAAWILERRYPERYGRRQAVALEHSGQVDTATLTPDERAQKRAEILARTERRARGEE